MRPAGGEKKKDKRRKRGTGGVSPDSRNVDRISPSERKEFERLARTPAQKKQRDTAELKRYGFVGASEREQARNEKERITETRRAGRLSPARKGQIRPQTPEERRALLAVALERSGVMADVERAPRFYDERSRSGQALRLLVGPPGEADTDEKIIGSIAAFPLFRPIRLLKAPIAAAGALRLGGGSSGARAAAEAAYKTPTIRTAVGRVVGRRGGEEAGTAAAARIGMAADPRLPPAEPQPLPEEAITPEQKVRESLGPARSRRAAQKKLYSEERGRRIGAAEEASEAAGGGIEGYRAATGQLGGELPKVKFEQLREGNLSQEDLDGLFRAVQDHPDLRPFEKRRAMRGLLDAFEDGKTPQASQIKLWQTVFGEDAVSPSTSSKVWKAAGSVVNIPRSLMSTLDLSGTLRQGLVVAVAHPKIVARNMKPQVKALVSERNYGAIMDEILARPNAARYESSRLPLTTLDDITTREEQFSSGLAETLTGGKRLSPVRASGRAYSGFLNKTRADAFDLLDDLARAQGHNVESAKFERDLARLVGSMTGRGPLPQSLAGAATFLNATFFSPRLMTSRIDLLFAPATYMRAHPFVRRQALKSMLRLYAAGAVILGLAAAAGGKVSLDPRNADFAKVRIGNTRIDIFGGFQQYVRLLAQITSGTIISSTTGERLTLGADFGDINRKDITERFAAGKFSPPVSFVYDFFKGTDYEGEPFSWKNATLRRMIPFIAQDVADLYRETGSVPAAVGGAGLIGIGVGTQTYGNRALEKAQERTAQALGKWKEPADKAWQTAHPGTALPVTVMRAKQTQLQVRALLDELEPSLKAREVSEGDRTPEQQNAIAKQELAAHFAVLFHTRPALEQHRGELMRFVRAADPAAVRGALTEVKGDLYEKVLRQFSEELSGIKAQERQKAFSR